MQPYTEALERALGGIVARATGELATIKAQAEAVVSAAAARVAEAEARLLGVDTRIAERLAAVRDGTPGRDGAAGERGERGDPGERGPAGESVVGERGEPGEPGPNGEDGAPGRDGIDGEAGRDGIDGKDGERGEIGIDGADGRDGERGADGAPGSLPIAKSWTDAVHYASAAVTHHGALWQALRDTAKEPPHADWICLAARGSDAPEITVRETYDPAAAYQALNIVALNGGAFIARKDDPGPCPGEGWQLFARQGHVGKSGDRGPAGPKGERGTDGMPLVAATVDNEGMLTLTNGDGSTVNCDLYPLLTRIAASPR